MQKIVDEQGDRINANLTKSKMKSFSTWAKMKSTVDIIKIPEIVCGAKLVEEVINLHVQVVEDETQ